MFKNIGPLRASTIFRDVRPLQMLTRSAGKPGYPRSLCRQVLAFKKNRYIV